MRRTAENLIKHELKPSDLLASRPCTECFILQKAEASEYFNYLKRISKIYHNINVFVVSLMFKRWKFNDYNYAQIYVWASNNAWTKWAHKI